MSENASLLEIHKIASKMSDSLHVNKTDIETNDLADDGHIRMNQLVMDIYNEFESILKSYGDKPLKNIVPLVANLLETLNEVAIQKEKLTTDLNIITDHHAILLSQYETGKVDTKFMEQRLFSLEDELQETRKELENIKSTNLCAKNLLELKLKNATDQIYRLEERESEVRRAYSSLRSRYGDLFRTHVEYLEKKRLTYADESASPSSSAQYEPHLDISLASELEACASSRSPGPAMTVSHKGDSPYNWGARRDIIQSIYDTTPELLADNDDSSLSKMADENLEQFGAASDAKSEAGDADELPSVLSTSKSGATVDFNISKEVSKLVKENNELEQTKNALNIVIHDLLTNIEELQCEHNQLRETISQQQLSRSSTQLHVASLEKEVTRLKKALSDSLEAQRKDTLEMKSPFSRRLNFTREEMAKVLMERNQLKEDLFDLRESMRWSEVLQSRTSRVGRNDYRSWQRTYPKHGFLEFFSRLFHMNERSSVPRGDLPDTVPRPEADSLQDNESMFPNGQDPNIAFANIQFLNENSIRWENSAMALQSSSSTGDQSRNRHIRPTKSDDGIKSHLKEWIPTPFIGQPCRTQPVVVRSSDCAPDSTPSSTDSYMSASDLLKLSIPLPKPLYRRPIPEALSDRMQVYSAACTYGNVGSLLPSGKVLAGRSTFFSPLNNGSSISGQAALFSPDNDTTRLSNEIWICLMGIVNAAVDWTSADKSISATIWREPRPAFSSQIVVVDANSPSRFVDSFSLPKSVVTCLTAVPGVSAKDYDVLRLSDSIWKSVDFVTPNRPSMKSTDPTKRDSSLPRTGSVVTESARDSSARDCNTLSSLRNCLEPNELNLSECPSSRSSAFQSLCQTAPGAHDFYRVERQRFAKHACPSTSSNLSTEDDICVGIGEAATAQQTVWLGCQNGDIFLHSSMTTRRRCLQTIRLPSGITAICHFSGRVFVSLANGHIVVLRRRVSSVQRSSSIPSLSLVMDYSMSEDDDSRAFGTPETPLPRSASQDAAITSTQLHGDDDRDQVENASVAANLIPSNEMRHLSIDKELISAEAEGCWDLSEACVITCGPPNNSVTALTIVPPCLALWAAYGKEIIVIDTTNLNKITSFEVESSNCANVKCMSYVNDGVWISLRRESVVRLYNAFSYSLMQEVNLKYIITQSLGIAEHSSTLCTSVSATALRSSTKHLWIGTNSGVIIIAPFLSLNNLQPPSGDNVDFAGSTPVKKAGEGNSSSELGAGIDLSKIMVSAYGHTEAVNFLTLVSVPGSKNGTSLFSPRSLDSSESEVCDKYLMLSGGVGFIDQRNAPIGSCSNSESNISGLQGHLLAWTLPS